MLADGYEPRFDRDYEYGRQAEIVFDDWLKALRDGQAQCEDKHKSIPDTQLYIELEQNAHNRGVWKPSGLSVTTAEVWAFHIARTGVSVLLPVARLRRAVELGLGWPKDGGCSGDNPTRGRLIHLELILSRRCDP